MARFVRRLDRPVLNNYRAYRPYLELDFRRTCCYCGLREVEGHIGSFHIEHFRPKKRFPHLECSYANLYYACFTCNRNKWDFWPSVIEEADGFRFWDPCADNSFFHFSCDFSNGSISAKTKCGEVTIREVKLDRPFLRAFRQKKMERLRVLKEAKRVVRGVKTRMEATSDPEELATLSQVLASTSKLLLQVEGAS